MQDVPVLVLAAGALGAFGLSVFGLRGLLDIRTALRLAELNRLDSLEGWPLTRAFCGCVCAAPVLFAAAPLGAVRWLAALAVAALGFWVTPHFLYSARRRVAREVLDDLPLHLDLIALAMEGGSSLPAALAMCAQHAPEGVLRRAWMPVLLEIHSGVEPLEALRNLEQRLGLRPFGTLLAALRCAQRLGLELAPVLREKARQSAANRFARAERMARAAPLKLWATLMLCIAPCTLVVLAFPVARMLALAFGR